MKQNLYAYLCLTRANLQSFRRDRTALIWSFVLPLLMVLVFGSLFGNTGDDKPVRFPIGLVIGGDAVGAEMTYTVRAFEQIPVFETHVGMEESEKEALRRGERRAVVVFPADFAARLMQGQTTLVRVLYDPTQPAQITQPVRTALRQVISAMDRQITRAPSLLEAQEETVVGTRDGSPIGARPLDYILPGLFGVTVMHLGLFTAIPLITLRERGILKRFRSTPIAPGVVVAAQVTQRLVVGILQATLLLLVGQIFFGFHMVCSPFVVLPVLLLGLLLFIAVGAVLASVARTQEAGMTLVQIVNLPLMLLSGLLIPAEMLPEGLRPLMNVLPTTYLGDALRQLMLNAGGAHTLPFDLSIIMLYLVIALIIASRSFRWE